MLSAIPFQLAYSVSIHKVQGLEYNSVKVVISSSNSEQISHGIFYTAITRANEKSFAVRIQSIRLSTGSARRPAAGWV